MGTNRVTQCLVSSCIQLFAVKTKLDSQDYLALVFERFSTSLVTIETHATLAMVQS